MFKSQELSPTMCIPIIFPNKHKTDNSEFLQSHDGQALDVGPNGRKASSSMNLANRWQGIRKYRAFCRVLKSAFRMSRTLDENAGQHMKDEGRQDETCSSQVLNETSRRPYYSAFNISERPPIDPCRTSEVGIYLQFELETTECHDWMSGMRHAFEVSKFDLKNLPLKTPAGINITFFERYAPYNLTIRPLHAVISELTRLLSELGTYISFEYWVELRLPLPDHYYD
ncbi:hypothetical protein H0H92_012850 [Tricholoma furcatifolium]|nr:hypothetical protein H0H92_012850 [Tricholoma furcatifolium]